MDMLYLIWCRLRAIWSLYGVCGASPVDLFLADGYGGLRWAHEICAEDNEERAIVVASMNEMAYVLQAWLPLLVWQQVDAPQYRKGFITLTFLSASLIGTGFITKALHKSQDRRSAWIPEADCDSADQVIIGRQLEQSQAQGQHLEDGTIRSFGEDNGSEHVQIISKN